MNNATKYDPSPTTGDYWKHAESGMSFVVKKIDPGNMHDISLHGGSYTGEIKPTVLRFSYRNEGSKEWIDGSLVLLGNVEASDGDE